MPVPDTPTPLGALRVVAGRYRLDGPIATGGMAEVWAGHDEVLARPVAVKVLLRHLAVDPAVRERFRREAVTAARLAHPHVVATYDTGVDGSLAYIVMELVPGGTLRDLMASRGPLPLSQAVSIGDQIADALGAAHRAGLVHRDIKPANVLVADVDGSAVRVKVTDFGIAKAAEEAGADLTLTGTVIGTPKYLSPEQVEGREPDARTDLYALGVVLYEMIAGRAPFEGPTQMATALSHLRDEAAPLASLRPGVPARLDDLVSTLLAKDPAGRFGSAPAVRAALATLAGPAGRVPGYRPADTTTAVAPLGASRPGGPVGGSTPGWAPPTPVWPPPDPSWPPPRAGGSGGSAGTAGSAGDHAGAVGPGAARPTGVGGAALAGAVGQGVTAWDHRPGPSPVPPRAPAAPGGASPGGPAAGATALGAAVPGGAVSGGAAPDGWASGPVGSASAGRISGRGASAPDPSGAGRLPSSELRRAAGRRRALPGVLVLVLVVVGALVAATLLERAGRPSPAAAGTSATPAVPPVSTDITEVSAQVVEAPGRPADHASTVDGLIHGAASTGWSTDEYDSNSHFDGLYPGVGVAIQLSAVHTLQEMTVTSTSTGWTAEAYVGTSAPPPGGTRTPAAVYGPPTGSGTSTGTTTTISLGGRRGSWVLLWLTSTGGPPFQASLQSVAIS